MSEAFPSAHLQASNLCWQAAAAHIVRDVSLYVTQGELVGLLAVQAHIGACGSHRFHEIKHIRRPGAGNRGHRVQLRFVS